MNRFRHCHGARFQGPMPLARSGAHSVRFVEGESLGEKLHGSSIGAARFLIDTFGRFAALCQRSHRHDHGHNNGPLRRGGPKGAGYCAQRGDQRHPRCGDQRRRRLTPPRFCPQSARYTFGPAVGSSMRRIPRPTSHSSHDFGNYGIPAIPWSNGRIRVTGGVEERFLLI